LALENGLRRALERDELSVFYQPQVDAACGCFVGTEALLRWRHPELGLVSPAEFIPMAEATGLIGPIGEWVLREACRQNVAWQREGRPPIRVAVNLSARQFWQHDLVQTVAVVLRETGLKPEYLELEITESVVMEDAEAARVTLNQLAALGVSLAIDDFGTGYSSLSYLKNFPIAKLKIDRSFIRDITTDSSDEVIAAAVIGLGRSLKLDVIAEGVETAEQLARLQQYGCTRVQGYLFGRPQPAPDYVGRDFSSC